MDVVIRWRKFKDAANIGTAKNFTVDSDFIPNHDDILVDFEGNEYKVLQRVINLKTQNVTLIVEDL